MPEIIKPPLGGSGTSYWSRVGTTLSPLNVGDDVDLGTGEILATDAHFTGKLTVDGAIDPTELDMPDNAPVYLDTAKTNYLVYSSAASRMEIKGAAELYLEGTSGTTITDSTEIEINSADDLTLSSANGDILIDAPNEKITGTASGDITFTSGNGNTAIDATNGTTTIAADAGIGITNDTQGVIAITNTGSNASDHITLTADAGDIILTTNSNNSISLQADLNIGLNCTTGVITESAKGGIGLTNTDDGNIALTLNNTTTPGDITITNNSYPGGNISVATDQGNISLTATTSGDVSMTANGGNASMTAGAGSASISSTTGITLDTDATLTITAAQAISITNDAGNGYGQSFASDDGISITATGYGSGAGIGLTADIGSIGITATAADVDINADTGIAIDNTTSGNIAITNSAADISASAVGGISITACSTNGTGVLSILNDGSNVGDHINITASNGDVNVGATVGDVNLTSTAKNVLIQSDQTATLRSNNEYVLVEGDLAATVKATGGQVDITSDIDDINLTADISVNVIGAFALPITTKTNTDYTILDDDQFVTILVSTGNTDRTITLPTVAANSGRILNIKKTDSGTGDVIIDGEGAETVDGAANYTITLQNESITIQSNGSAWYII